MESTERILSLLDGETDITNAPALNVIAQTGDLQIADNGGVSRVIHGFCQPMEWHRLSGEERHALLSNMRSDVRVRYLARLPAA